MAVVTGTGSGKLTEEEKAIVAKAKKPIDVANKFRLVFLFVGVLVLLFIYFGNKAWEGVAWYDNAVNHLYQFLLWDLLLMLLSTLGKVFLTARYNGIVKKL